MDKIIFLDIDGVLNSQLWYKKNHDKYKSLTIDKYHIDPSCVNRLNHIVYKTDAKIVISSSWRVGKSVDWFKHFFNEIGLKCFVIGKTKRFYHHGFNIPRGCEIKKYYNDKYNHPSYFEDVPSRLGGYVILDDDGDMLYEQRDNFVQTDNRWGLQDYHVPKIISILNSDLKQNIIKELE